MRALRGEDAVDVAVVRLWLAGLVRPVPFGVGLGNERAQRARVAARRILPVEAVALAGIAAHLLRVDAHARAGTVPARVLALGLNVGTTRGERPELVSPDTTVQYLLVTGRGVKPPLCAVLHQRDGERPVVLAEMGRDGARRERLEPRVLHRRVRDAFPFPRVLDRIAGGHEVVRARPEDHDQRRLVVLAESRHERTHRLGRAGKRLRCRDVGGRYRVERSEGHQGDAQGYAAHDSHDVPLHRSVPPLSPASAATAPAATSSPTTTASAAGATARASGALSAGRCARPALAPATRSAALAS